MDEIFNLNVGPGLSSTSPESNMFFLALVIVVFLLQLHAFIRLNTCVTVKRPIL